MLFHFLASLTASLELGFRQPGRRSLEEVSRGRKSKKVSTRSENSWEKSQNRVLETFQTFVEACFGLLGPRGRKAPETFARLSQLLNTPDCYSQEWRLIRRPGRKLIFYLAIPGPMSKVTWYEYWQHLFPKWSSQFSRCPLARSHYKMSSLVTFIMLCFPWALRPQDVKTINRKRKQGMIRNTCYCCQCYRWSHQDKFVSRNSWLGGLAVRSLQLWSQSYAGEVTAGARISPNDRFAACLLLASNTHAKSLAVDVQKILAHLCWVSIYREAVTHGNNKTTQCPLWDWKGSLCHVASGTSKIAIRKSDQIRVGL